uniref:Reverse transcriptase domain-containing protein n=1 Tax=Tanacetum cinerariifolium TaxID=118510 RepID=A0A6L2MXZ6_TANCI|nr:reverse transcriptase domain-containing protein [Tanacetum cinerariifolium]
MATNGNSDNHPPLEGGDLPVPDLRTIEELCQPTLNGRATVGQTQNVFAAEAYNQGEYVWSIHENEYPSSLGSGTLPSNTITNPKEDLKGITTRSGIAYKGPTIPTTSSLPRVVEHETEVTKNTVPPTNNESTEDVQPLVVQVKTQVSNSKPVVAPVVEAVEAPVRASKPNPKLLIPYPFTNALILMPKFASTIKSLLTNKEKLFELARTPLNEHCLAVLLKKLPENLGDPDKFLIPCDFLGMDECLALADLGASINLMPLSVWNKFSLPELSPTCMTLELADRSIFRPVGVAKDVSVKVGKLVRSTLNKILDFPDFLLEETDAFLAIKDEPISSEIDVSYYYSEGDILLLKEFLKDDPSSPPLLPQELKVVEPKNEKSSIDEPPEVELKDLPPHLEYAFLEGDDKLPVIIAIDLKDEEKTALIKVLKLHKQALAWQLFDIKGNEYYCFVNGFSGYFQIPIDPQDQEKTTFTCPYGTFAYRRMPFGLCNAPVFGKSFRTCLSHLDKMLKWCEDTNLCLNWEKVISWSKRALSSTIRFRKTGLSGQVEVSNRDLKRILERTVGENHTSWLDKLDDALYTFRTTFKTSIRCTPYKLMYEKACHLPIKLEHKAYWALKHANFDLLTACDQRKVQLNELNELRDQAYENSLIYKEKTKRIHDSKIKDRFFNGGDRVLLFNSRLKIFLGNLKTRWIGPFTVTQVFPYGTVELSQTDGPNFKVNGHRLKHYFGEDIPPMVVSDLESFPKDQ